MQCTRSYLSHRQEYAAAPALTRSVPSAAPRWQARQRRAAAARSGASQRGWAHVARSAAVEKSGTTGQPSGKEASAEPTVEEVMTPSPVVLLDTMPIRDAVRLLLDRDVSGAPVVNEKGKLVGILSESDLMWKGAGTPQDHFIIPPVFLGFADAFVYLRDNEKFEDEVHKILARTVGEAMNKHVVSISPSETMAEAAQLMLRKQVNRLPVVEDGHVVGVVTRHDVLRGMFASNSPFL